MRRLSILAVATGLAAAVTIFGPAAAQSSTQAPTPAPQQASPQPTSPEPPKAAPIKPYKPVAITLPQPQKDAAFVAFRGKLADVATKTDTAALAKLVVAKGFFWDHETGDRADPRQSGFDNLAAALGLKKGPGPGWDLIANFAGDPTASEPPNHKGFMCAPADPGFDPRAFGELLDDTQTEIYEWGYPVGDGLEVRAAPLTSSEVVGKVGLNFIRVIADNSPAAAVAAQVKVVLPSGKTGYIPADQLAPLGNDQLCYIKEGGAWKVGGYVGAGDQQ